MNLRKLDLKRIGVSKIYLKATFKKKKINNNKKIGNCGIFGELILRIQILKKLDLKLKT